MLLLPIKHENMAARRWPVVTLSLIAINAAIFLLTTFTAKDNSEQLGEVRVDILLLAASHPELKLQPEEQLLVDGFRKKSPRAWAEVQNPQREVINAYDARIKTIDDLEQLQAEMDRLGTEYVQLKASSINQQYGFIPAHPTVASYLSANFLHGGWMHLIGNMWFLWLAGFVLEDVWGRWLYSAFYLIAGAAALQIHAWANPGSLVATVGASGAVAALMGAFLVRFPKMKIEMLWVLWLSITKLIRTGNPFRYLRFKASTYWLLPLWLTMEVFSGALFPGDGVAHWAHVGGFVFGAVVAVALQYSGLEHKANQAIEEKIGWTTDTALAQASTMMEQGQADQALQVLTTYVSSKPNSPDAWALLRQVHQRRGNTKGFLDASVKTCSLHLRAHAIEAAFQDYAEFIDAGGGKMPATTWLELCKGAEEMLEFERALSEYEELRKAYPTERQALTAQLSAARLCLKKLNRPKDALALYEAAAKSPIPHLDWDQLIQSGIKEAKAALSTGNAAAAGAP
jgi:membrane associated rhomboid family serine protease